jgi:hypothetical protein
MNEDERLAELVYRLRKLAATNEKMAVAMLAVVRILARDTILVLDTPPGDPLRPIVVSGARQRAEKVLTAWGDAERAH